MITLKALPFPESMVEYAKEFDALCDQFAGVSSRQKADTRRLIEGGIGEVCGVSVSLPSEVGREKEPSSSNPVIDAIRFRFALPTFVDYGPACSQ